MSSEYIDVNVKIQSLSRSQGRQLNPLTLETSGRYHYTEDGQFELLCQAGGSDDGELVLRSFADDAVYMERSSERDFTVFKAGEGSFFKFPDVISDSGLQIVTSHLDVQARRDSLDLEIRYVYTLPFAPGVSTVMRIQARAASRQLGYGEQFSHRQMLQGFEVVDGTTSC